MRRRIWCETLPLRALRDALNPLQRRGIDLLAAVRPTDLDEVPALLDACAAAGVRCGLWPMLADADGRWPSRANAALFDDLVARTLARAPTDLPPPDLAVDLEPPFGLVARWFSGLRESQHARGPRPRGAPGWRETVAQLEVTAARARDRGGEVIAAAVPMALLDPVNGPSGGVWQSAMGTPVDAIRWDHVSSMLYTSMFEGWSRGVLSREDARHLLVDGCRRVRARFGAAGGVSLGAVSTGALGDEPVYRSPDELADDVALCASAGVNDLTLFDYGGAVARGGAEAWLDAFTAPPRAATPPRPSRRVRALLAASEALGRAPLRR